MHLSPKTRDSNLLNASHRALPKALANMHFACATFLYKTAPLWAILMVYTTSSGESFLTPIAKAHILQLTNYATLPS